MDDQISELQLSDHVQAVPLFCQLEPVFVDVELGHQVEMLAAVDTDYP